MIQVYTGDGKGKTTAAVGLACRAAGHGRRVAFIQFMKADATTDGEFKTLSSLPGVTIRRFGDSMLRPDPADIRVVAAAVREGLSFARALLQHNEVDVLIMDEANVACFMGLIEPCDLLAAIEPAGPDVEVIVTGRGAPPEITARADLVTEMVARKHPYDSGVKAREGVDF